MVEIIEVNSKVLLKQFIELPAIIHQNHKNWVPPIYSDEWTYFNPKKNESFTFCDTVLFLAKEGNSVVGRVMGIVNNKFNEEQNEKDVRFCYLETYDDQEVASLLLQNVEKWGMDLGMGKMVGPLAFSDKDPQGLLIEGFDEPMVIASNCNFEYQVRLVENYGFKKLVDLVVYKLEIPKEIPPLYERVSERTLKNNPQLRVISFNNKIKLRRYIFPVLELVNETFKDIYAFSPLSKREMKEFANRYIFVLDPRFLKVIENEKKEVVAFVIGMPDISQGIKSAKGKLFPFGFIKLFKYQKRTKQLNLLLGAIREDYRGKGLDSLMGIHMFNAANRAGLEYIDSHLELEHNKAVRAEMEKMGGVVYKRYRIFSKQI